MLQTAHQSAAYPGNFGRVQRKILFLCHFYGNRDKLGQMGVAAKTPAADADSSQDFCLIPHADLPQLNPCFEHTRQILYQLPEVNPSVCCKIKQHFVIIKSIFRINELHIQSVLADLFLADTESFFFLPLICRFLLVIPFRGYPQHRL